MKKNSNIKICKGHKQIADNHNVQSHHKSTKYSLKNNISFQKIKFISLKKIHLALMKVQRSKYPHRLVGGHINGYNPLGLTTCFRSFYTFYTL